MNVDEFWQIIGQVHQASGGDMQLKCNLLERELRQRSRVEIRSFSIHFGECFDRAYDLDLWGAAFVIRHGCGESSFRDFRSTLISMGREVFECALLNPDSLAATALDARTAAYEGYQHVPRTVLGEGPQPDGSPDAASPATPTVPPKKPTGTPFKEWEMSRRYPKLAEKYGYRDSDWMHLKTEKAQGEKKFSYRISTMDGERSLEGVLMEMLLDAGIIPPSGWIPPRNVLERVLHEGHFVYGMDKQTSWQSFDLSEEEYWLTVASLEKAEAARLAVRWPEIKAGKLQHDHKIPRTDDFPAWIVSLRSRGLVK